jgi:hypothetical protein
MSAGDFPPGWRIVPATAHGVHHILAGRENQDSLAYRRLGAGFVVAVADGAGSRPRSALGSRLAVDTACDAAARTLPAWPGSLSAFRVSARRFARQFFDLYDRRIAALARAQPRGEPGDYASTLLAVAAHPPCYTYLGVGDAFLVLQRGAQGPHLIVAGDPDGGAATTFLTTPRRFAQVRRGVVADPGVTGLALCTDGLAEGMLTVELEPDGRRRYGVPADFGGFFRAYADRDALAIGLTRHLNSPEVSATTGDDRTMVLAVHA